MTRWLLLFSAVIAFATPLQAQERALGDAEVLALADSHAIWCENWSETTRDCESLYTLRREPDGQLILAGMFLLTDRPAIMITIADIVTLENGRICSSGNIDDTNLQASVGGVPSAHMTDTVRLMLAEGMAEYQNSIICQQFFTEGDPGFMGEIVTADDQRLYDFESTYRMGTPETGFLLRPQIGDEPEQETIDL